jgi:hypothetical protein
MTSAVVPLYAAEPGCRPRAEAVGRQARCEQRPRHDPGLRQVRHLVQNRRQGQPSECHGQQGGQPVGVTRGHPPHEVVQPPRPRRDVLVRGESGPVDDHRCHDGETSRETHGEHRHPAQQQGQRCQHDDEHAEVGQHDDDLVVQPLQQDAEQDEDEAALEVVAEEPVGVGGAVAQVDAHRRADDDGEERRREVLRDGGRAADRAEVRDEHRHDGQAASGIQPVEAGAAPVVAGRRDGHGDAHGRSLPVERRQHAVCTMMQTACCLLSTRWVRSSGGGTPSAHPSPGRRSPRPGRHPQGPGARPTPTRTPPGHPSPRP